MTIPGSSFPPLPLMKAMRSFTMRRFAIFACFSLAGALLAWSDALVFEQEVVMVVFVLIGFIMSLLVEDRKHARFPVIMHAVYAYRDSTGGEGVVEDVSMSGCKVRSTTPAVYAAELRLQVYPPGQTLPIEVQKALVRWTANGQFGLQFSKMQPEHEDRLRHLISQLPQVRTSQDCAAAA